MPSLAGFHGLFARLNKGLAILKRNDSVMPKSLKQPASEVHKKVKIYMQTPEGAFRPLMWFRSHKQDEIFWAPYGVSSKECMLRGWFPDEFVARDDANQQRYYFRNYIPINEPVDHFSSHMDGSFFLKGKHRPPIYSHTLRMREKLGADSPVFLEFIMNTEVATKYRSETPPRSAGSIAIRAENGAGIEIHGAIAGLKYDIEGFMKDGLRLPRSTGPIFSIGNFRAGLVTRPIWPEAELIEDRTRGTLITLRFLLESGVYRHKTFLFD